MCCISDKWQNYVSPVIGREDGNSKEIVLLGELAHVWTRVLLTISIEIYSSTVLMPPYNLKGPIHYKGPHTL